jgi:hypothetical protein
MASKAKAAHEARIADQDRQDAAQRDDKGRVVEAAIATLTADVLPLLAAPARAASGASRNSGLNCGKERDRDGARARGDSLGQPPVGRDCKRNAAQV